MRTLNVKQAAQFLKLHPVTLLERARAGAIPGAKVGKQWVFLEEDLAAHVRALYGGRGQKLQGDGKGKPECHSTSAPARRIGGSGSHIEADEYSKALGLPTGHKHSNSTTG